MVRKIASKPLVTYHVVRQPDRPATSQASSNSRLAVEKAKPPRAPEARSGRQTDPVRGVGGRVSILSVRSFVRLATCLMGAFHGVGAQAQDEPPGGLDEVVNLLSGLGVEVFYVAQGNEGDDASLSSMNAVLHGLCVTRDGVLLQQDGPVRSRASPKIFTDARRVEFDDAISKKAHQVGQDPHRGFADLWNSGCISPYSLSSDPTKPNPLAEVISKAPHGTVVGLSKEFAFYLHAGPNTLRFPGHSETVPVPKPYQLAEPQLVKQNESYGLFQASSDARPSALIVTTQTVTPAEVEELWDHFKDQFTVSMVPLEDGVQAMIVAPLSARSELLSLLQGVTGRGIGPIRPPPPMTLDQRTWDNSYAPGGGAIAVVGEPKEPPHISFDLPSPSSESPASESPAPESALDMLAQLIQENCLVIAGACVVVYKCAFPLGRNAGPSPDAGSAATQRPAGARNTVHSMHGTRQHRPDERAPVWFDATPVLYHGTPGAELPGRSPDEVAESAAQAIREKQADRELARAAATLQEHFRPVARGDLEDEVEYKGWEMSAPRTRSAGAGKGLQAASAATSATNAAATPVQVSIAEIFDFGREMAAEEVPDGADVHGVRRGKDIFVPGPDIVPHWHLTRKFVLYKLSDTHHVYVARGDKLYRAKAESVGISLDDENLRDRQLLRMKTFILTGTKLNDGDL